MIPHADVHCYALRRLNPFLGVVQVETPSEHEGLAGRLLATQNKDRQLHAKSEHLIEQISLNLNRRPIEA